MDDVIDRLARQRTKTTAAANSAAAAKHEADEKQTRFVMLARSLWETKLDDPYAGPPDKQFLKTWERLFRDFTSMAAEIRPGGLEKALAHCDRYPHEQWKLHYAAAADLFRKTSDKKGAIAAALGKLHDQEGTPAGWFVDHIVRQAISDICEWTVEGVIEIRKPTAPPELIERSALIAELKPKRPCYDRDHTWLTWHDAEGTETHCSNAAIVKKWNTLKKGNVNIGNVITGIKTARKEIADDMGK